jgi:prolipoprotein diacylglyceryltransferase
MDAINIGPLSFRVGLIVTFAAILLGLAVGNRAARARGVRVEPMLWVVIGAGVLAARIGFVLQYLDMYARAPLGMLNIRDGGFSAPIGAVAAAGAAVWLAWRDRDRRRPLAVGVLAGAAVGMIGALLTVLLPARQVAMPALSFSGLDGRTIRLESLAGKPVVINLWASWCPTIRN